MVFGTIIILVALAITWGLPLLIATFIPGSFVLNYAGLIIITTLLVAMLALIQETSSRNSTGTAAWGNAGATLLLGLLAISNIIPLVFVAIFSLF